MDKMEYRAWIDSKLKISRECLYLTQADCRSVNLSREQVLEMTETAMKLFSTGRVEMPSKIGIHPQDNGSSLMHAMPSYVKDVNMCGMKWAGCFTDNKERFGYPQTSGLMILNDQESGYPICVMDAAYVTEVRTGAAAVVSAKCLAKKNAKTFGQFGCGVQGSRMVSSIELGMPELETIYIMDIFDTAMDRLIEQIQPHVKAKIVKSSYREIADKCDVISSACFSKTPDPQIKDEWVRPGQLIIMNDGHFMFEDTTFKRASKYVTDCRGQYERMGEYGYYTYAPEVYAEHGEILAGLKPGRENDEEIIVTNNIGMSAEDIVVGRYIFDQALEHGIGTILKL